jgi:methylenetetrahydrofolate dehydrogenase (NADP+)/methenyltetrahydrofolate cyclohydrolase
MSLIIDGKQLAGSLRACLKHKVNDIKDQTGKTPCLAVCLVGDDPASQVYVASKEKAAASVGINSLVKKLPASIKQSELQKVLADLSADSEVHGILLQLPLPEHLDPEPLLLQIDPLKDVDGLHPYNLGLILAGHPILTPCTPAGILTALQSTEIPLKGKRAVIIGRSRLVGKPIAELLLNQDMTVTIAHSKTPEPELIKIIGESDLVVAAIGKPGFVKAAWLKPDSIVIDVGINRMADKKLVGDIEFEIACERVRAITPVPGGIGPLTVAHLLVNTVKAFELQHFDLAKLSNP